MVVLLEPELLHLGVWLDVGPKVRDETGRVLRNVDGAGLDHCVEVSLPFHDKPLVGIAPSISHDHFFGLHQPADRGGGRLGAALFLGLCAGVRIGLNNARRAGLRDLLCGPRP